MRILMSKFDPVFVGIFLVAFLFGCDPQRLKKCEWYLTPNPSANKIMKVGWVSLCVSNFETGKQRCFFTAKPQFVEKMNGVPFKYSAMKYTDTFPREIISLTPCRS